MSAIGDYVHWSYAGYVKEQGAQKTPYFSSYKNALSNRENHFYQWIQKQENKAIEDLERETQQSLNLLKSFKENKGNISQVENSEMAMALLEDLWNELDTKYLKVDKIAAAASGLLDSGGFGSGTNVGNKTFYQQATTSNINSQIESLLNNVLSGINDSVSKIFTEQNLNTQKIDAIISKTKQKIDTFMSNLQQKGKIIGSNGQKATVQQLDKIFKELKNAIQTNDKLNESIDIEGLLNELAIGLSGGLTSNQYKGDISEALISIIARRMAGVSLQSVDTAIKDAIVTGQQRSSRGIDTTKFVSDVDWNQTLADKKYVLPFGDFIVSAEAVQDKVDVQISLENGSSLNISAKNYNPKTLKKGVTNESASFLSLIQNENQNDLINHYLNLNAVTGKGRNSLMASAEEVNDYLRKVTVAKLISGYNTITGLDNSKMKEVNVFAVFNSKDYTVKFYNMKDILDGVFNSGRYKKLYIPQYFYKANLRTDNYTVRISNVLKQLEIRVSYTMKEDEYVK